MTRCVVLGCDPKLIGCVERFIFRQLFPGGFVDKVKPSSVIGLSTQSLQNLLKGKYDTLPRFDAGIHIRAQRATLEKNEAKNQTQFAVAKIRVYDAVFQQFEKALRKYFFAGNYTTFNSSTGIWPRIFLSCDDVEVRDAFVSFLQNISSNAGRFHMIYVNASEVQHTKHMIYQDNKVSQSLVDTAFDWYSLSLSNITFAWRVHYGKMASTFLQSASRVSSVKQTQRDHKILMLSRLGEWLPVVELNDSPASY